MARALLCVMLALLLGCGKGKPTGGSPPNPTPPTAQTDPPTPTRKLEFSPDDALQTLRWIASEEESSKAKIKPGNAISAEASEKEYQQLIDSLSGTSVKWTFKIKGIRKGPIVGVAEPSLEQTIRGLKHRFVLFVGDTVDKDAGWARKWPTPFFGVPIKGPPEFLRWLESASSNDSVMVSGKIERVNINLLLFTDKWQVDWRIYEVNVKLTDIALSKP